MSGPLVALLMFWWLPEQYINDAGQQVVLSTAARIAAAVAIWMAIWWITEAISIYATALLPLVIFPLTGTTTIKAATAAYGHELIYLFLGGFILALALERCGLHQRFALIVLRAVGARPTRIIAAFMFIAAFISMWVTNTATTIMLLPVALSITKLLEGSGTAAADHGGDPAARNFPICLLLAIAYAATVGGIGTIIGTAPNVFLVSYIRTQLDYEISFALWMQFGVPLIVVFLPIVWWLLSRVIYRVSNRPIDGVAALLDRLHAELGPMSRAEKLTLLVFLLTAGAWVTRPLLSKITLGGVTPLAGLTDSGIAIMSALTLFVTPVHLARREFLMDWQTAVKLPWGLLILFGGGLSLAAMLDQSGFSAFLGSQATILSALPIVLMVALVTAMTIFLTELTSNTATTATLIPVLYAVAIGLGINPILLIIPAGIAASCAFMLPVATPPNAIVFGSGQISIPQMSRAGFWLNLVAILLIPFMAWMVIMPVLGVSF
ncbi:MAG: DASS family sodium-coupled anion symporter [Gammaproteobacteria bacterium]|nr:DASS family sodium-coupled anion symporter [Gammaproteobacteria bacterium]